MWQQQPTKQNPHRKTVSLLAVAGEEELYLPSTHETSSLLSLTVLSCRPLQAAAELLLVLSSSESRTRRVLKRTFTFSFTLQQQKLGVVSKGLLSVFK